MAKEANILKHLNLNLKETGMRIFILCRKLRKTNEIGQNIYKKTIYHSEFYS